MAVSGEELEEGKTEETMMGREEGEGKRGEAQETAMGFRGGEESKEER